MTFTDADKCRVAEQSQRILVHRIFQTKPRQRDLLTFLVKEAFLGHEVKSSVLAAEVLQTDKDDLARREVGKLRVALNDYYTAASDPDPLRMMLPEPLAKKGYQLIFRGLDRLAIELDGLQSNSVKGPKALDTPETIISRGSEARSSASRTGMIRSLNYPLRIAARIASSFVPPAASIQLSEEIERLPAARSEGDRLVITLTPGIFGYCEAPIIAMLEDHLGSRGCRFLRAYYGESPSLFLSQFRSLRATHPPDAFVIMPPASGFISFLFSSLTREIGIPVVTIDRELGRGEFNCLEPDHQTGAVQVVKELLRGGPTTAVCVIGNLRVRSAAQRLMGFEEQVARHPSLTGENSTCVVRLGERLLGKGQFQGLPNLIRVVNKLNPHEHIAFFADNPQRGVEVIRRTREAHGEWPVRWRIGWFDAIDEGLGDFPAEQLPQGIVGCKVDRKAIAQEAAEVTWGMITNPHGKGLNKVIRLRPALQA